MARRRKQNADQFSFLEAKYAIVVKVIDIHGND